MKTEDEVDSINKGTDRVRSAVLAGLIPDDTCKLKMTVP